MNVNAAKLAARGLSVFELAPGAKFPSAEGWQERATSDALTAYETISASGNVGVSTEDKFVLDVDAGKGGLASLEKLKALGAIPDTYTVRSARDGLHLYFDPPRGERFKSRAYRIVRGKDGRADREHFALEGFPGIDIRAAGGLVVGAGSVFDGKPYVALNDLPIAPLPEFIADLARRAAPKLAADNTAAVRDPSALDRPTDISRAIAYLLSAAPSVEGEGGDPHLITVANRVMDHGITPAMCAELMAEHWNDRCSPPWDLDALAYKCHSAAKSRQEPIGRNDYSDAFSPVEFVPYTPPAPSTLLRFLDEISIPALLRAQERSIVKHLIAPGDFSVLYGPSGGGKSFAALMLAFFIALGKQWNGRRVRRARVLYVNEEGQDAFGKRLLAAERAYGDPGRHFAQLAVPAFLSRGADGDESVRQIIKAVQELKGDSGDDVVIMLDTLAQAMAGEDENSVEAMMFIVRQRIGLIRRVTGAHIMAIHHTGKNGNIRGSSALYAAADLVIRLELDGNRRTLIAQKVKDGEEGELCDFSLGVDTLGIDDEGEPMRSCYVKIGRGESQQRCAGALLEILDAAISEGVNLSPKPKANNYAAQYAFDNQGTRNYSLAEYSAELVHLMAGPLTVETYKNRGREAERVAKR